MKICILQEKVVFGEKMCIASVVCVYRQRCVRQRSSVTRLTRTVFGTEIAYGYGSFQKTDPRFPTLDSLLCICFMLSSAIVQSDSDFHRNKNFHYGLFKQEITSINPLFKQNRLQFYVLWSPNNGPKTEINSAFALHNKLHNSSHLPLKSELHITRPWVTPAIFYVERWGVSGFSYSQIGWGWDNSSSWCLNIRPDKRADSLATAKALKRRREGMKDLIHVPFQYESCNGKWNNMAEKVTVGKKRLR